MSSDILHTFDNFPYLSDPAGSDGEATGRLSRVQTADKMEVYVKAGVDKWLNNRRKKDFLDSKSHPLENVQNVQRWLAHVLLTTTINLTTALPDKQGNYANILPDEHFYNSDLFGTASATQIQVSPHARRSFRSLTRASHCQLLEVSEFMRLLTAKL
jgi:hypothetical protein